MLVLSRNENESITIKVPPSDVPQQITVTFVRHIGQKARIGFGV